jgi:predicted kinase
MTTTVYMLVGLPGSGKSTWAKEHAENLKAEIFSSDKLREELYGDEKIQGDNGKLFELLHKRMKSYLDNGNNVVYDATNISQKRRIHFNKEFKNYRKEVIYFNSSHEACIMRDSHRDRTVGKDVIMGMFTNLQVPTYAEGWDKIHIVYDQYINPFRDKKHYEKLLLSKPSHEYLFDTMNLGYFKEFLTVYNLPQDNPHHTFSVSRHIHAVYEYVHENYHVKHEHINDYIKMLWFAVFHDVGKGYTKSFLNHKGEIKRYASFIAHENVSSQIAVSILHSLGYDDDYILDVAELIQLHMRLLNATEKTKNKLKNFVDNSVYYRLLFFRDADISAK